MSRVAQPALVELEVTGRTCASCVRRVERALQRVEVVSGATVNLARQRAEVQLDLPVEPARLTEAVEASGYRASVIHLGLDPADEAAIRRERRHADLHRRGVLLSLSGAKTRSALRGKRVAARMLTLPGPSAKAHIQIVHLLDGYG